jgi:hypothetical protein
MTNQGASVCDSRSASNKDACPPLSLRNPLLRVVNVFDSKRFLTDCPIPARNELSRSRCA